MFLYSHWISLPINTRVQIAHHFGIVKKGSTEVVDNRVSSDGYLIKDVEEALNIPALQKFLVTDEDEVVILWEMLIDKIEGRIPFIKTPDIDTTIAPLAITPPVPTLEELKVPEKTAKDLLDPQPLPSTFVDPNDIQITSKEPGKKKFGRPKGTKKVDGKWVYPPTL